MMKNLTAVLRGISPFEKKLLFTPEFGRTLELITTILHIIFNDHKQSGPPIYISFTRWHLLAAWDFLTHSQLLND